MKFKTFAFAAVCAAAMFGAAACGGKRTDPAQDPPPEETVFEMLNRLMETPRESASLTVRTTYGGVTLRGDYFCETEGEGTRVRYTYERMALITGTPDGGYHVPDEPISTYRGAGMVVGGAFTCTEGDPLDLSVPLLTASGISFDERYFADVSAERGKFSAAVTSPAAFLGRAILCTEMSAEVSYTDSAVGELRISYRSEGADVVLLYLFG